MSVPLCGCYEDWERRFRAIRLHRPVQDVRSRAWLHLLELIGEAVVENHEVFDPRSRMDPGDWESLVTLPPELGRLRAVRRLVLFSSNLECIPPEIGAMESLVDLDLYRSYRLHWLPYEITRCTNLVETRISTRALYGNNKYRHPFPDLYSVENRGTLDTIRSARCSVCREILPDNYLARWISLRVGTDVMPLLVLACSTECVHNLPESPDNTVQGPHRGGRWVRQPPPR